MRKRGYIDHASGIGIALNAALFQIGWFACVLGAASDVAWEGTVCVAAIVAWHLFNSTRPGAEAQLLLLGLLIGAMWETLMHATGWIVYPHGDSIGGFAPYWLLALWVLFATTLNSSLAWLKPHLWTAALFGGVGGPLSFFAGARLGAAQLAKPCLAMMALAIGWAVLMPLLLVLADRLCGAPASAARNRSGEAA